MKRVLLALLGVVMLGQPALADHDNVYFNDPGFYNGDRWNDTISETYCLEGFNTPLTDGEYENMRGTTTNRINTEFEVGTDISTDWSLVSGNECSNNYNFASYASQSQQDRCQDLHNNLPNIASRISYEDLGADTGEAFTCDLDDNGKIDFFWVAVDSTSRDWHWNYQTNTPFDDWDYAGLITHEFGHAVGFDGHWPSDSDACPQNSNSNTMCPGGDLSGGGGIHNTGTWPGTWYRTLEGHDIGEINQVYP